MDLIMKRLYDYQYALDMAGKFMNAIKGSELAKNTIVAITADNNTIEGLMYYDNYNEEAKRIPFYIYFPKGLKPKDIDTSQPGDHKDFMATLYDLTLSDADYYSVGSSLVRNDRLHCGFNKSGIVLAPTGAFKAGDPKDEIQKQCDLYRRAAIAVTDYLIKHQYENEKNKNRHLR
jgi:arylsulfatase A-like enzyme